MKIERISVSRINSYEQCPLLYDAIYNKNMRIDRDYFTFGTIIHDTLEIFHRDSTEKGQSEPIEDIFNRVWTQHNLTDIEYFQDGLEIIANYKMTPEYKDVGVLVDDKGEAYIERYFNIYLDDNKQVMASGIIDRINKLDDGSIEVLDYKTSRMPHSRDEMESDRQLSMYNLAVNHLLPEYDNVKLSLMFLRHVKLSTHREPIELEDARQYFINTYYQIKFDENPEPKLNKYCGGCPIRHTCPAYKELTENEKLVIGEIPEHLPKVWAQLEDVKDKAKILDDRRKELEKIIKIHLEVADEDHVVIGNKKVYMEGMRRSFYPYRLVESVLGANNAKNIASVPKAKVDKVVKGDEDKMKALDKGKVEYYSRPSIKSSTLI